MGEPARARAHCRVSARRHANARAGCLLVKCGYWSNAATGQTAGGSARGRCAGHAAGRACSKRARGMRQHCIARIRSSHARDATDSAPRPQTAAEQQPDTASALPRHPSSPPSPPPPGPHTHTWGQVPTRVLGAVGGSVDQAMVCPVGVVFDWRGGCVGAKQRCNMGATAGATAVQQRCNRGATVLRLHCNSGATVLQQRRNRRATEVQQRCNRGATEVQQCCNSR